MLLLALLLACVAPALAFHGALQLDQYNFDKVGGRGGEQGEGGEWGPRGSAVPPAACG